MAPLIHPTAVIHPGAELDASVEVGPYAVVGAHVRVGPETKIGPHVVIEGWTEIGAGNQIYPGAVIGLEPQDLKYDGSLSLVQIGDRNQIREYVTINRSTLVQGITHIGDGNLLMAYVHVAHNCWIDNEVIIANAVSLGGHVHIESQARISGVLGIHQFVHVGQLAMVGGMSKIVQDVPPYMLVQGNPARVRTLNLVGLQRAGMNEVDQGKALRALKKAFRLLYRSDLTLNQAIEQIMSVSDSDPVQHLCQFLQQSQVAGRRGLTPGK